MIAPPSAENISGPRPELVPGQGAGPRPGQGPKLATFTFPAAISRKYVYSVE